MRINYLRRGECPICSGNSEHSSPCREFSDSLIGCRSSLEPNDRRWEPIREKNGYGHKQDKLSVFYLYRQVQEKRQYTDIERERFKLQIALEKQQALEKAIEEISPLSLEERSTEFKKLINSLTLGTEDHANLTHRGLSDEVIAARGFKSFRSSESVSSFISELLPGISTYRGIKQLNSYKQNGFLTPIWNDFKGEIRGFQKRNSDPNVEVRYTWLRSTYSPHVLVNGSKELPIAAIIPSEVKDHSLNFCEGTLKPLIAAEKLNKIFIGASGGLFSSSPNQTKEILSDYEQFLLSKGIELKAYCTEDGKLKVTVYPDAGDVINSQVIERLKKQITFLESLGLAVSIAWWGQITKACNECDELTEQDLKEIRLIDPRLFFLLADNVARRTFTSDKDKKVSEPFMPYVDFKDGHIYGIKSPLGSGKTQVVVKFIGKHLPDILKEETPIILLGTRNSLLVQTIEKLNKITKDIDLDNYEMSLDTRVNIESNGLFVHIKDKEVLDLQNSSRLALCVDSLLKLDIDNISNPIVILDELLSLWSHIYFSKTHIAKFRIEILEKFKQLINKAKLVICLDGNLTDWAMNWFKEVCGNKPIIKIENTFVREKINAYQFLLGSQFNETAKISINDKRAMIEDIIRLIKAGEKIVISSDSQKFIEVLEELFKDALKSLGLNRKSFRLDSKTKHIESQEFLKDPNNYLTKNKIYVLSYSPTAESGLDISLKGYFAHKFGFYFGVNSVNVVDAILQQDGRVRDDQPTKIWVAQRAISLVSLNKLKPTLEQLKQAVQSDFRTQLESIVKDDSLSLEEQKRAKLEALEHFQNETKGHDYNFAQAMAYQAQSEGIFLRESVIFRLRSQGHKVITYVGNVTDADLQERWNIAGDKRDNSHALDIFNAPEPKKNDEGFYETSLNETNDAHWAAAKKAGIYNRLPDIQNTNVWSRDFVEFITCAHPNLISQIQLELLVIHPDKNKAVTSTKFKKMVAKRFKDLWNTSDTFGIAKALTDIGIMELVNSNTEFEITDQLPQQILDKCRNYQVRQFLGSQGKLKDSTWLKGLLARVGYTWEYERKRKNDSYIYKVVPIGNTEYRTAIMESLRIKLEKQTEKAQLVPWFDENNTPKNPVSAVLGEVYPYNFLEVPQTLTTQGLEPAPKPDFSLSQKTEFWTRNQENDVPEITQETVLDKTGLNSSSQGQNEVALSPLETELVNIDHTDRAVSFPVVEKLLAEYGLATVTAAVAATIPPALLVNDKQATLYQWLAELKAGARLRYVGVTHIIRKFVSETVILIESVGSNSLGGITCRIDELVSSSIARENSTSLSIHTGTSG